MLNVAIKSAKELGRFIYTYALNIITNDAVAAFLVKKGGGVI